MVRVSTGIIQCRTLYAWLFTLLYLLWIKRGLVSLDECLTCSSTDAAAMHQFSLLLCLITLPHTANVALFVCFRWIFCSKSIWYQETCRRRSTVSGTWKCLISTMSWSTRYPQLFICSSQVRSNKVEGLFFFYLFFTHNRIGIKICKLSLFFFF